MGELPAKRSKSRRSPYQVETRMKILLVSPFTSTSGSAIRFWNMARQFSARGYRVVYVDRSVRGAAPMHSVEGVRYCPSRALSPFVLDILYSTVFSIVMLLRNLDCDVFYALKPAPNNCIAALLAKLLGKTVLLDIDDLDYEYLTPGIKRVAAKFFFRFFPRFFPLVTCHTPALLSYCKEQLRLSGNRLYYLAQGVSEEFLTDMHSEKAASQVCSRSIVYVATLGITSDFEDLLPMLTVLCREYPDLRVSVVGDGPRRSFFEGRVRAQGVGGQVSFTGRMDHARLPQFIASHGIGINYLRPSKVNDCRAILKLREYLACRLQVVCNDVGDAGQFSSCINLVHDLKQMEEALRALLRAGPGRNEAGRKLIEDKFRWERIMGTFMEENRRFFPGVG